MDSLRKVFNEFINRLREKSLKTPVIVEGKNDVKVLQKFGIKNVISISGKNYFDLLEKIPPEVGEVILLTDIDKQGEKIFKKLKTIFESQGLKVDGNFRDYLRKMEVKEVEELEKVLLK